MSRNEISRVPKVDLTDEDKLELLWEELKKPKPKSYKEYVLGEIRRLEVKLGVEPRRYNGRGD